MCLCFVFFVGHSHFYVRKKRHWFTCLCNVRNDCPIYVRKKRQKKSIFSGGFVLSFFSDISFGHYAKPTVAIFPPLSEKKDKTQTHYFLNIWFQIILTLIWFNVQIRTLIKIEFYNNIYIVLPLMVVNYFIKSYKLEFYKMLISNKD